MSDTSEETFPYNELCPGNDEGINAGCEWTLVQWQSRELTATVVHDVELDPNTNWLFCIWCAKVFD